MSGVFSKEKAGATGKQAGRQGKAPQGGQGQMGYGLGQESKHRRELVEISGVTCWPQMALALGHLLLYLLSSLGSPAKQSDPYLK